MLSTPSLRIFQHTGRYSTKEQKINPSPALWFLGCWLILWPSTSLNQPSLNNSYCQRAVLSVWGIRRNMRHTINPHYSWILYLQICILLQFICNLKIKISGLPGHLQACMGTARAVEKFSRPPSFLSWGQIKRCSAPRLFFNPSYRDDQSGDTALQPICGVASGKSLNTSNIFPQEQWFNIC